MSSSGPNSPGTMAGVIYSGGNSWGSADYAKVSDNVYTSAGPISNRSYWLQATNFGFAIPSGATIVGIEAAVERKSSSNVAFSYITDELVQIIKGGTISGDNKADTSTHWPTSDGVAAYGAADALWGLSFTDTDINSSTFGFGIVALAHRSGKASPLASVDFMSMTVYYTEGGGGGSNIPVIMHQLRQQGIA